MPSRLDITLDFVDVKMDYLALMSGTLDVDMGRELEHSGIANIVRNQSYVDTWAGGSALQTAAWIRNGYSVPGSTIPRAMSAAPRKRTRWTEDGDDLDLTRAWSGDPTPFSVRETGTKQGLRIEAEMFFSAGADASMIADYGRWITALASGYAASGHDLEISAIYRSQRLWAGNAPHESHYRVVLKKFGQQTDYVAWSPLFAPTGYRHIIFSMWSIDARRHGFYTTSGYGPSIYGAHNRWGVTFDDTTNTLKITAPYGHTGAFPEAAMAAAAQKAFTS